MRNLVILLFLFLVPQITIAQPYRFLDGQTVFGTPVEPDPAAIFQVESTTKGFLPPRLTSTQRDALESTYGTLPIGLQIYNTTEFGIQVWNGSGWIGFLGGVTGFGSEGCMAVWAADATPELEDSQFCVINDNELRIVTGTPADDVDMVLGAQSDGVIDLDSKAEANAGLDVNGKLTVTSTTEASTPCPEMTEAQRDLVSAARGECVYNTDTSQINVYDGTDWILVGGGGLDKWEASFDYKVDDVVWVEANDLIYVADTAHTSGGTFSDANWTELSSAADRLEKFPSETNDNRLVRTDGDGNALQGSLVEIDDLGAMSGLTELTNDNLNLNGNTVSTLDTNGDLILDPNGTGNVQAPKFLFDGITEPTHQEGLLFYDSDIDALSFYNAESEVTLNIGEENWVEVRNNTGSTITDGSVVYISGATGLRPEITLAQANDFTTSKVIGIATHDIETSSNGYVTTQGIVRGINTSSFTDGDTLYLSPTVAGEFTTTQPTKPDISVLVGTVVNAHISQGKILVANESFPAIGFTEGALAFGNGDGVLIEDPTNLSWDDTADTLTVNDLDLSDSSITATATDANVDLVGNGDGRVRIDRGGTLYEAGSINPELPELLSDPSFEVSDAEWTCTAGASTTQITTAENVTEGSAAVQIDFTSDGASCSLTESVADGKAGVPYQHGISLKTSDSTVTLGFLDDTRTVSEPEVLANGAFVDYITQTAPSTSVKTTVTGNTSDQAFADAAFMRRGSLPTGASRNCGSDLECENGFNATGTIVGVSNGNPATITDYSPTESEWYDSIIKTSTGKVTVDYTSLDLTTAPYFDPIANRDNDGCRAAYVRSVSATQAVFDIYICSSNTADDTGFSFALTKRPPDHKTTNQQGVTYTGGNEGASAIASDRGASSNISVGTDTVIPLGQEEDTENITWDGANEAGEMLKSGKYLFLIHLTFSDTSASPKVDVQMQVDSGSGYALISNDDSDCNTQISASTSTRAFMLCPFYTDLSKGDKFRFIANSDQASTVIQASGGRYPRLVVVPILDREGGMLDLNGTPKYEGEDRMIAGYASFGGATDGSVCDSSPCTRYREVGALAGNMSVSRSTEGQYDLTITGFKPNSFVSCQFLHKGDGTSADTASVRYGFSAADSSGEVSGFGVTYRGDSTQSPDRLDTFFQIKCEGLAP